MNFRFKCSCAAKWMLVLLAGALMTACTVEIDESKTFQRNGLVYEIGKDEPFTGIITGTSRGEDYRRIMVSYKKEYKDGLLQGRSYFYYPDGKIESVEPYEAGILDGVVTRYYENGQIRARIHFVDGYRGGPKGEMFWDRQGNRSKG